MKRIIRIMVIALVLISMLFPAGNFLPAYAQSDDAAAYIRDHAEDRDFLITGSALGLGAADQVLADSSVRLTVDSDEDGALFRVELVFAGSQPVTLFVSTDSEGVSLCLPGLSEKLYTAGYDTIREIVAPMLEEAGVSLPDHASSTPQQLYSSEQLETIKNRYYKIIAGLVRVGNLSEKLGTYTLQGLGETKFCMIVTCTPTADDWRSMLTELFTTAASDEELASVLEEIAKASFNNPAAVSGLSQNGISSPDDLLAMVRSLLNSGLENMDSLVAGLDGISFEVATFGSRVYAVKVSGIRQLDGTVIGYESFGSVDTERRDALVVYADGGAMVLAMNSLSIYGAVTEGNLAVPVAETDVSYKVEKTESGKLNAFDFGLSAPSLKLRAAFCETDEDSGILTLRYEGGDASLEITCEMRDGEDLALPDLDKSVLRSQEDFQTAAQEIMQALSASDLFERIGALSA